MHTDGSRHKMRGFQLGSREMIYLRSIRISAPKQSIMQLVSLTDSRHSCTSHEL